ncbi:MAG: DUF5522 domain-containing protein [Ilumatobacteraceae bacterium]
MRSVENVYRLDHLDRPHPKRLRPEHPHFDAIMARHREAIDAGAPTYRDPVSGLAVFTAAILASRNACCNSGCRHCPYIAL